MNKKEAIMTILIVIIIITVIIIMIVIYNDLKQHPKKAVPRSKYCPHSPHHNFPFLFVLK